MANGDLAAQAGLTVFAGTQDRRQGYDNDNIRGDELARHILEGGHALDKMSGTLPVAKGGTGTATPGVAASNIGAVRQGGGTGMGNNLVRIGWAADSSGLIVQVDSTVVGKVAMKSDIPSGAPDLSGYQRKGENYEAGNGVLISAGGRNSQVSQGYVAAYFNGDGTLRSTPSARRFKQDIAPYSMTEEEVAAFLSIPAVHYRLVAMVADHGDAAPVEFGFIAEDVMDAGYDSVVPVDNMPESETYGQPISVDYARLVVPLHVIVKQQHEELAQLRAELAELRALITPTEGNS